MKQISFVRVISFLRVVSFLAAGPTLAQAIQTTGFPSQVGSGPEVFGHHCQWVWRARRLPGLDHDAEEVGSRKTSKGCCLRAHENLWARHECGRL